MRSFPIGKEALNFLAMTAFFGGGLLLSKEFITIRNMWDYVVLQVLTMMNGLGLCVVLILWASRIRSGKTSAREPDCDNGRKETSE